MPRDGTLPVLKDKLSEDQTLRDLVAVDELLSDESKWCQGSYKNDDARVCVLGALEETRDGACWWTFSEALGFAGPAALADFNDAPERTFADIKKRIASARARRTAQLMRGES